MAAAGEQIRPHLTYLPGLADLLGRVGTYVEAWVREFYASLWIDPEHRFIHFSFAGRDFRLQSAAARDVLRLTFSRTRVHEECYGRVNPPRRAVGGIEPPVETVSSCFLQPFTAGSSR